MRLRTDEPCDTACKMRLRRCSCWLSNCIRLADAAAASSCRCCSSLCALVDIGIGRLQSRAVAFQFLLQLRELRFIGRDLGLRARGTCL